MVGRISGTTEQIKYTNSSDVQSGYNKLAEDMKEDMEGMFSFTSCAFFCCPK